MNTVQLETDEFRQRTLVALSSKAETFYSMLTSCFFPAERHQTGFLSRLICTSFFFKLQRLYITPSHCLKSCFQCEIWFLNTRFCSLCWFATITTISINNGNLTEHIYENSVLKPSAEYKHFLENQLVCTSYTSSCSASHWQAGAQHGKSPSKTGFLQLS